MDLWYSLYVVGHSHAKRMHQFFANGDADREHDRHCSNAPVNAAAPSPHFGTDRCVYYDAQGGLKMKDCEQLVKDAPEHHASVLWIGENDWFHPSIPEMSDSLSAASAILRLASILALKSRIGTIVMPLLPHPGDESYNKWAGEINDNVRQMLSTRRRTQGGLWHRVYFMVVDGQARLSMSSWMVVPDSRVHRFRGTVEDIHLSAWGYHYVTRRLATHIAKLYTDFRARYLQD